MTLKKHNRKKNSCKNLIDSWYSQQFRIRKGLNQEGTLEQEIVKITLNLTSIQRY